MLVSVESLQAPELVPRGFQVGQDPRSVHDDSRKQDPLDIFAPTRVRLDSEAKVLLVLQEGSSFPVSTVSKLKAVKGPHRVLTARQMDICTEPRYFCIRLVAWFSR